MGLIMSLVLGSVGLVLIKSAFTTPPDPRVVLKDVFTGNFKLGTLTEAQQAFVGSRAQSDKDKHPTPTATTNNRAKNDPRSRWA